MPAPSFSSCGTCRIRKKGKSDCKGPGPTGDCQKCVDLGITCLRTFGQKIDPMYRNKYLIEELTRWTRSSGRRFTTEVFPLEERALWFASQEQPVNSVLGDSDYSRTSNRDETTNIPSSSSTTLSSTDPLLHTTTSRQYASLHSSITPDFFQTGASSMSQRMNRHPAEREMSLRGDKSHSEFEPAISPTRSYQMNQQASYVPHGEQLHALYTPSPTRASYTLPVPTNPHLDPADFGDFDPSVCSEGLGLVSGAHSSWLNAYGSNGTPFHVDEQGSSILDAFAPSFTANSTSGLENSVLDGVTRQNNSTIELHRVSGFPPVLSSSTSNAGLESFPF